MNWKKNIEHAIEKPGMYGIGSLKEFDCFKTGIGIGCGQLEEINTHFNNFQDYLEKETGIEGLKYFQYIDVIGGGTHSSGLETLKFQYKNWKNPKKKMI